MSYHETALLFEYGEDSLIGILAIPENDKGFGDTAVIVIVGGPQYRVGSHRLFTLFARSLSCAGYPSLRFDYRGMGDSTGTKQNFEEVTADVGAAIDVVQKQLPSIKRVVLFGLCDGASAALLYLHATRDSRVRGLCLLNPWVRSQASLSRVHLRHYYAQRLLQLEFWRKLSSFKASWGALTGLLRTVFDVVGNIVRPPRDKRNNGASFQQRMAGAAAEFNGDILLVVSEADFTAKEFVEHVRAEPTWRSKLTLPELTWAHIKGADHTFSTLRSRMDVFAAVLLWLEQIRMHNHQ
jgi:uncharacterized protein